MTVPYEDAGDLPDGGLLPSSAAVGSDPDPTASTNPAEWPPCPCGYSSDMHKYGPLGPLCHEQGDAS